MNTYSLRYCVHISLFTNVAGYNISILLAAAEKNHCDMCRIPLWSTLPSDTKKKKGGKEKIHDDKCRKKRGNEYFLITRFFTKVGVRNRLEIRR